MFYTACISTLFLVIIEMIRMHAIGVYAPPRLDVSSEFQAISQKASRVRAEFAPIILNNILRLRDTRGGCACFTSID